MNTSGDITLTDKAIARIAMVAAREKKSGQLLRISIEGGGCQGFSYNFSFDDEAGADDEIFEFGKARLIVDKMSLDLMRGAVVDFHEDLMGAHFRIDNPLASSSCGCGTSFNIEE